MPAALVLGARNLGGEIARHLAQEGWRVAAAARSPEGLAGVTDEVELALTGDASDPADLARVLGEARAALGPLDLVVNAVSASRAPRSGGAFGGGPILDADLEGFRGWGVAVAEQAFVFLSESARALAATQSGGTLVQVTGGSARRALPGRGLWGAGAAALRALVHAAAQELREQDIHVALLIADGTIASAKTAARTGDQPAEALLDQAELARAVAYLAGQSGRGLTHELVVTPQGDRWLP